MSDPLTMRVQLAPGRVLCAIDAHGMPLPRHVGFYDGGKTPMPEGEVVAAEEGPDGKLRPSAPLFAGAWAAGSLVPFEAPPPAVRAERPEGPAAEATRTTRPGLTAPVPNPPTAPADAGEQVR